MQTRTEDREAVIAGNLGRVEMVHGFFGHRFDPGATTGWRSDPAVVGAGILDDSALHLIDLLLSFGGGRAYGVEGRLLDRGSPVPHSFECILDMDSGATIVASGSYLSPAQSVQEEISILGTHGSLFGRSFCRQWNTDPPTVFFKSADGTISHEHDMTVYPTGRPLPLVTLLDVLQNQRQPESLHSEASRVLEPHRVTELIRNAQRR